MQQLLGADDPALGRDKDLEHGELLAGQRDVAAVAVDLAAERIQPQPGDLPHRRALDDRALSRLRAREIGFVFQQFFLAEHAAVRENVADGLLYAGVPAAERCERADEALERVGLAHRATFKPTKLSGGERQRVAIARALVGRPAIVLADEPTGNLDSATGASIMELLRELNGAGATILMITHDAGLADALPRQIRMLDGAVVTDREGPA